MAPTWFAVVTDAPGGGGGTPLRTYSQMASKATDQPKSGTWRTARRSTSPRTGSGTKPSLDRGVPISTLSKSRRSRSSVSRRALPSPATSPERGDHEDSLLRSTNSLLRYTISTGRAGLVRQVWRNQLRQRKVGTVVAASALDGASSRLAYSGLRIAGTWLLSRSRRPARYACRTFEGICCASRIAAAPGQCRPLASRASNLVSGSIGS